MNDWDWNDLFGAFFDRVEMDGNEKEEFVEDFYNMNQDERNTMIEVMAEVIVGDMEYESDEFPCFIPDNGCVLN